MFASRDIIVEILVSLARFERYGLDFAS